MIGCSPQQLHKLDSEIARTGYSQTGEDSAIAGLDWQRLTKLGVARLEQLLQFPTQERQTLSPRLITPCQLALYCA
jgi:hypothetical protein